MLVSLAFAQRTLVIDDARCRQRGAAHRATIPDDLHAAGVLVTGKSAGYVLLKRSDNAIITVVVEGKCGRDEYLDDL